MFGIWQAPRFVPPDEARAWLSSMLDAEHERILLECGTGDTLLFAPARHFIPPENIPAARFVAAVAEIANPV